MRVAAAGKRPLRILKRVFAVPYKVVHWLYLNLLWLGRWRDYRTPKGRRPAVLMMPVYSEPEPFYQTWQKGIEAAGWRFHCLYRNPAGLKVSHQLLLYLLLCLRVQVVHLVDLDLQTLFGDHNAIRRAMSLCAIRVIVGWPRLLRKRVVYTFGNFTPHEFDTPAERKRHRLICSLVQDVVSPAPSMSRALVESGVPADRIWPAEHADIAHFFPVPEDWPGFREQKRIPRDATVILYTGSIRPYKGIEVAVEALKRARDPSLRLVIAGSPAAGYTTEGILALVEGDERIVTGPLRKLSNEEMGWLFRAADFCVLPYRDVGHSGMVCQSLGLGVPVIGSRAGSLPDYLGGGAGLLFTPGDAGDLARVLDELPSFDRARAREIGLAIMRPRTPERIGQRLVRIYEYRRGGPAPDTNWLFGQGEGGEGQL